MLLSDFRGGENSGCQKLSFYCAVHITLWDSSIQGVATGECCCWGSSVDVRECSTVMYFLACSETFRDWQVLLSEVLGIQIGIQLVFFQARSQLPSTLGWPGKGGSSSECPDT